MGEKNVKYKYKIQEYAHTNTNTEIQIHYKVHNFKYTNTVAAVLRLQVGETVNSWTNRSGGEKCLVANSKLETDGYIKQRKTGTNNG